MEETSGHSRAELLENIRQNEIELSFHETAANRLRQTLITQKALAAPIRRIPPEILTRILCCLLEIDEPIYQGQLGSNARAAAKVQYLMLVCKHWESVIRCYTNFWTAFTFEEGRAHKVHFRRCVLRSGGLPLQVCATIESKVGLDTFWSIMTKRILHRVSKLSLTAWSLSADEAHHLVPRTLPFLESANSLTHLFLTTIIGSTRDEDISKVPSLNLLALHSLCISYCAPAPLIQAPHLRHLRIDDETHIFLSHLLQMIGTARLLTHFTFDFSNPLGLWPKNESDTDLPAPLLNNLQSLDYSFYMDDVPPHHPKGVQLQTELLCVCRSGFLTNLRLALCPDNVRCLKLSIDQLRGLTHLTIRICTITSMTEWCKIALKVVEMLESSHSLEELTISASFSKYALDLILQALLFGSAVPASGRTRICDKLTSLTVTDGNIEWPAILHRLYTERIAECGMQGLFTVTLASIRCSSNTSTTASSFYSWSAHPMKDAESWEAFNRKNCDGGPGFRLIDPLFEIDCPCERMDLLCTLLNYDVDLAEA